MTIITTATAKENKIINLFNSVKGTSFIGVNAYESMPSSKVSLTQIANFQFLVGIDYSNFLQKQLDILTAFNINSLLKKDDKLFNETLLVAYNELVASLMKRTATQEQKEILLAQKDKTIVKSQAMQDAFDTIGLGLKAKTYDKKSETYYKGDDRPLYVFGIEISKTVIREAIYLPKKPVKSQLKTICKRLIEKESGYINLKFKTLLLGNIGTLNLQKQSITL